MIPRLRLLSQALFLGLSLSVFFGLIGNRALVCFYEGLHVFPSLSALAWLVLPPCLAATALVLLLTAIGGRLYCSYLCPAGFLQDLAARVSASKSAPAAKSLQHIRYMSLFLALGLILFHSSSYHWLDHVSNLGRVYGLFKAPLGPHTPLALAFLGLLLVSLRYPRWFCSTLCPSGALFTLMQRRSALRLRVSGGCTSCGACARACPALCIADDVIDEERCIRCLECVTACPAGAVELYWERPWRKAHGPPGAPGGRRRFLALAAGSVLAALGLRRLGKLWPAPKAVVPPGGKSAKEFFDRCAACQACAAVCPTKVLVSAGMESGPGDFGKARLDYDRSYCSFECNACLAVCPTGAISYFPLEIKQRIKIGSARLDKSLCIPYAQGLDCGACQECCPTAAIRMVKHGEVYGPVPEDEYCIGCGACQAACPASPRKAIRIEASPLHTFAFLRGSDKASSRPASGSEFPF